MALQCLPWSVLGLSPPYSAPSIILFCLPQTTCLFALWSSLVLPCQYSTPVCFTHLLCVPISPGCHPAGDRLCFVGYGPANVSVQQRQQMVPCSVLGKTFPAGQGSAGRPHQPFSRDLTSIYKYLKGGCKENGARLFSVVPSARTRGNRHKVKHKMFPLGS